MRVTKNTLTLTSTSMQFRWPAHGMIEWTAMEALEIAHQILLREERLLEMVRQEHKKQKASATLHEQPTERLEE